MRATCVPPDCVPSTWADRRAWLGEGSDPSYPGTVRTTRGLERLVTFVDAVVAIAITLLVLPLVDLAREVQGAHADVSGVLSAHIGQLGGFLLSFIVIARLWVAHHATFERVHAYDNAVMFWSLTWAMTIAFLPFPTQLIANTTNQPLVRALYIGTMTLSSLCLTVVALLLTRRPELRGHEPAHSPAGSVISTLGFVVAFVISASSNRIGVLALLVLLAGDPVNRLWHRRQRRRAMRAAEPDPSS